MATREPKPGRRWKATTPAAACARGSPWAVTSAITRMK
uniref:Cesa11 n=1 Tax=Arundo donax TaxID=35708 RepID=A0A0A9GA83_ARUDO